jgi:hypothetical protein
MTDKSSKGTDQAPPPAASEQQAPAEPSGKPVFIRRAKGMSFEEFKKVCIARFKEAGLLADEPAPSRKRRRPDEE